MNYQVNYDLIHTTGVLAGKRYHKYRMFSTIDDAKHFASCEGNQLSDELGLYHIADAVVLDLTDFLA